MQISLISTHHCIGGDLSGMTPPSFCRGSPRIWLPSVGPGNGMETASSPPVIPIPSMGNSVFCIPVCVGSVQDIYQVTFLESPGIGTQIILALEPRLRRAQSGSCHLVSLGGLFPEVCQVLSDPTPGVETPGVGSGTGGLHSQHQPVYTQCCYWLDMERSVAHPRSAGGTRPISICSGSFPHNTGPLALGSGCIAPPDHWLMACS